MGECRYGKEHSLITMSESITYAEIIDAECEVTKWCEVCGIHVKIKNSLNHQTGKWQTVQTFCRMPQIAKEVLEAEQKVELRYDKDSGFIGEGGGT